MWHSKLLNLKLKTGIITRYFEEKRYGFIKCDNDQNDYYFKTIFFVDKNMIIRVGKRVQFNGIRNPNGYIAKNISLYENS